MKWIKRLKKLFGIGLIFIMIFSLATIGFANEKGVQTSSYTIEKAYDYPVRPGMDEWTSYIEPEQKLKAAYVPEDILKNMTTEALVETVLNYPLLIDMYAFETVELGYQAVSSIFYGLPELASRSDAITALKNYNIKNFSEKDDIDITYIYANTLIDCIAHKTNSLITPKYTVTTVYTPNGTPVTAYYGLTWTDHSITQNYAEYLRDQYLLTYPSSAVVGPVNPKYNCHSYAWHSASTSNNYWIDDPTAYMTDGSYYSWIAVVGAKVFYDSSLGNHYDHSGIIIQEASYPNPSKVKSKWGWCALFTHYVDDCPYANYSPTVGAWVAS